MPSQHTEYALETAFERYPTTVVVTGKIDVRKEVG